MKGWGLSSFEHRGCATRAYDRRDWKYDMLYEFIAVHRDEIIERGSPGGTRQ